MKTEFMGHDAIYAYLKNQGVDPKAKRDTTKYWISSKVIRCETGDRLIAGMGSNRSKDDQIHLVVDAVNWHLRKRGHKGNLLLIFGKRKKGQAEVENAVATMIECLTIPLKVEIQLDGRRSLFNTVPYENPRPRKWIKALTMNREVPEFGKNLEKAISHELFKWYRNVTGNYWSGRVGGLEVCRVDDNGNKRILKVGKPGKYKNGLAREVFLNILKKNHFIEGPFLPEQVEKVAAIIRAIADSRQTDELRKVQREHLLESLVLSGKLDVNSGGGTLEPVSGDQPFQFPTLWSPGGNPRFIDALMRIGDIPYAVELKEPKGSSPGQEYRHAITQAVLYREFIRRADCVHPWFEKQQLNPQMCRAVVAFPKFEEDYKRGATLFKQHSRTGSAFGVDVTEIEGFNY